MSNNPWSSPQGSDESDPYAGGGSPYRDPGPYGDAYPTRDPSPYEQPYEQPYDPYPQGGGGPYGAPTPTPYAQPAYYAPSAVPPKHPGVTTALVLSLISLSAVTCGLPVLLAPVGMILGLKARKEIQAEPGRWSGDGEALAAFVIGLIMTVLFLVGIIVLVIAVALVPATNY